MLGGKIELKASGPIELHDSTISSNVNDVRRTVREQQQSRRRYWSLLRNPRDAGSGISAVSGGTQNGGNVVIAAQQSITMEAPVPLFRSATRYWRMPATLRSTPGLSS